MSRRKQAKPQHIHEGPPEDPDSGNNVKRLKTMEDTRICSKCCAEYFDEAEFLEHEKNCTKSQPVVIMKDGEGPEVLEEFSQGSPYGVNSDHEDSQSSNHSTEDQLERAEEESNQQEHRDHSPAYQGSPQDSNVTLEALADTKVAVSQHPSGVVQETLQAIPLILDQLVCLQQQQLQQIQLTEQIRIQVAMMAPQSLQASPAMDPLKALGAHLSQQLSAAAALIGKRTGTQSLSMETLKQSKLPPAALPPFQGSVKSDILKNGPDLSGRLLPQTPAALGFPNSFNGIPGGGEASKKLKSKLLVLPAEARSVESVYKHKCKYCGKTFGNDSALQIHLRSHTGERPFKCNICGNRFTTKGNLKVHFQRHRDKYPNISMNPHPVPEHLDNIPTSTGIPFGMSVPMEESNLTDVKPIMAHPTFNASSISGFKPFDGFGDAFSQRPSPSTSDGFGPEKDTKDLLGPLHHMNGEGGSGTVKLQQMVDGLEKRTDDPNECVICHRVLSCQSSLKMHYRTHTGERPYKCKLCGRAFSTKGNLKAHYGVHRANTPLKMQHSCPICQKKFTNAVVLQQHIRMHMGGQIPNTPAPPPLDPPPAEDIPANVDNLEAELKPSEVSNPLPWQPEEPQKLVAPPAFSSLDVLKNLTSALTLKLPSSAPSESEGPTNEMPPENQSPADSFHSSPLQDRGGEEPGPKPESDGPRDASESGALDLTASSSFIPKTIKEEPVLFVNGDYAPSSIPFMKIAPGLGNLENRVPLEAPLGPHSLFGSHMPARRSTKQHTCSACGKNFSSASALQIHERTHTGEKPFACNICGRAFTTKGNLKVHIGTHMWNSSSRRGQRLSLDHPIALMAVNPEVKMLPDILPPKELPGPPVSFDPTLWNQYSTFSSGLSMKTNEISVIQGGGVPLAGSSGGPLIGSTGGLTDGSPSGLPAAVPDAEKSGADGVPKAQFPHFMEEGKLAVN